MRIDEISEDLPGAKISTASKILSKVGLGGGAAKAEKAMKQQAARAYKLWLTVVPKVAAGGTDMNDPKNYSNYFGYWMSKNLRLDNKDPIIRDAVKSLKAQGNNISPRFLQDLILKMMGQQRAKTLKPGRTQNPPPPPSPTPPAGGNP